MSFHASAATTAHGSATRPAGGALLRRKCGCGRHTGGARCTACDAKRQSLERHSGIHGRSAAAPPVARDPVRSRGEPLDADTRSTMQARLGQDFDNVRVHTDAAAARSAAGLDAAAYTVGRDVVFGANRYAPDTPAGRGLIAHELAHVVQQRGHERQHTATGTLPVGDARSAHERQAERIAGRRPEDAGNLGTSPAPLQVQRQRAPIEEERSTELTPTIRPDLVNLTLNVLRGRRSFTLESGLTQPLNLLGVTLPGIPPSRVNAALRFNDRCNAAFQSAILNFEQNQRRGGSVFDLERNPWQVGAQIGYRSGTIRLEPGLRLGFEGSDFDTVLFTLGVTTGVSTETPPECIATPSEPDPGGERTPEQPTEPGTDRPPVRDVPRPPPRLSAERVHFFYDSTLLRPESEDALGRVASVLEGIPRLQVRLTGYASLEGSEDYNRRLGQRRADAIRDRLVLRGIDTGRISTLSLGESAPSEPEPALERRSLHPAVEDIRTANRRVEIVFIDPQGEYAPSSAPLELSTLGLRRPRLGRPPSLGVGGLSLGGTELERR